MFASAIVAFTRIAFGIFIGQYGPLRFKYSGTGVVLRGNQFYVFFLALPLVQYCGPQFFVITFYTFCHLKHRRHLAK